MRIKMPSGPCGFVSEGTVMRFNAEVLAEPGAPIYSPGDFMYGIDMVFVRDTVAPTIVEMTIGQQGPDLSVAVEATDAKASVNFSSLRDPPSTVRWRVSGSKASRCSETSTSRP